MSKLIISLTLVFGIVNAGDWAELKQNVTEEDYQDALVIFVMRNIVIQEKRNSTDEELKLNSVNEDCLYLITKLENMMKDKTLTNLEQMTQDTLANYVTCAIVLAYTANDVSIRYFEKEFDKALPRYINDKYYGGEK